MQNQSPPPDEGDFVRGFRAGLEHGRLQGFALGVWAAIIAVCVVYAVMGGPNGF